MVSVLMPCRNPGPFLDEAIQSALAQPQLKQLLIADGGSTPEVLKTLRRWQKDDSRVEWISEPDQGPADALNKALDELRQQLIYDPARSQLDEPAEPTVRVRIGRIAFGHWGTRQAPTETQRRSLEIGREGLDTLVKELTDLIENGLAGLEVALEKAGAPWTPGRKL